MMKRYQGKRGPGILPDYYDFCIFYENIYFDNKEAGRVKFFSLTSVGHSVFEIKLDISFRAIKKLEYCKPV